MVNTRIGHREHRPRGPWGGVRLGSGCAIPPAAGGADGAQEAARATCSRDSETDWATSPSFSSAGISVSPMMPPPGVRPMCRTRPCAAQPGGVMVARFTMTSRGTPATARRASQVPRLLEHGEPSRRAPAVTPTVSQDPRHPNEGGSLGWRKARQPAPSGARPSARPRGRRCGVSFEPAGAGASARRRATAAALPPMATTRLALWSRPLARCGPRGECRGRCPRLCGTPRARRLGAEGVAVEGAVELPPQPERSWGSAIGSRSGQAWSCPPWRQLSAETLPPRARRPWPPHPRFRPKRGTVEGAAPTGLR